MRDLWSERALHFCEVVGCDRIAPFGRYCDDCAIESAALERWYQAQEERRIEKMLRDAARLSSPGFWMKIRRRLWVWNLVAVAGALVYIGFEFGAAFVAWIEAGGWQ